MDGIPQVVVAGHICFDVIPEFEAQGHGLEKLLLPGKLVKVGPAVLSTGGAVSNTGLALYRLGIPTRLISKIGNDLFGAAILNHLRNCHEALANDMIIEDGASSSYSIILSIPGLDRTFLHCPGTNDTFSSEDIGPDQLEGAKIFHFGYPPVMHRVYADGGFELASLMLRVKSAGLLTSLDMSYPDPNSEAGRINWSALLERTLPDVDVFLPSLDEILFMLDRPQHDSLIETSCGEMAAAVDSQLLCQIGERLIDMGVAIAVLKLGSQGLYARTSFDAKRLTSIKAGIFLDPSNWLDRELMMPCFKANVVGTTGAGDCTIAGFIAGLLKGLSIEQTMDAAVAVGAFNVESADATSGVPDWDTVQARIHAGWERGPSSISLQGWQYNPAQSIWRGPKDKGKII